MKPVERNSPNNGDCLAWDDGTPLTTNEGKAWWSGWEEGNADGIADMQDVMREEIERLREMLIEARDDATRFGRLMQKCVIALREIAEGDRPDNDEQFCVGYWGATARAALGEGGMTDDNLTIAYMAGYHDAKSKYADEIKRLGEMLDEKWQQMPEANRLRFYISKIEKLSDKKEAHDVPLDVLLFRIYKYTRIALEGKE